MTDQGFIKIHRSILKWEWWQDANTMRVFMYLLLNANWEDSRFQGYAIPKGSLVTSYDSIATNLGISQRNVRTSILHLKKSKEVSVKRHSHFSIVTIANWGKYQCVENPSDNLSVTQLTINRQSSDNIKEYKEYKNIKNNISNELSKKSIYQNGRNPDFIARLEQENKNGKH